MTYNVTAIDVEGNSSTFECEEDEGGSEDTE